MANFWEKDPAVNAQETTNFWENDPVAEAEPKKKAENFWEKDKVVSAAPEQRAEDVGFLERAGESLKQGFGAFEQAAKGREIGALATEGKLSEAQQKMQQLQAEAARPTTPTLTADDIQRIAKEKGLLPAGAKVPSYIVEQILKSGPEMAVPILVGFGASAATAVTPAAPLAPVVGTLAGIVAYGYEQYGHFMERQALEKKFAKDLDPDSAKVAAATTAPLGYFVDRFALGVGNLGTKQAGKVILEELAKRRAAGEVGAGAVAKTVGKAGAKGAAEGVLAEAPIEVLEAGAERYQAGLPLFDEDAKREYFESFWGATALGGVAGGGSRAYSAYREYKNVKDAADELQAKQQQKKEDMIVSEEKLGRAETIKQVWSSIEAEAKKLQAKQAKEVEVAPEAVAPSEPGILDAATLKSFGINPKSNAYKALADTDVSTPAGQKLLNDVLDAYGGKVNYDAVNEYLQTVPVEEPVVTEVPKDVETEAIPEVQPDEGAGGVSVQTPFKRGRTRAAQAPEGLELGGVGAVSSDVGQPVGGTGVQPTPLEIAEINFDTVKAEYDTVLSNPKATTRQIKAVEAKITDAIEQLRAAQIETATIPAPEIEAAPEPVIETPVTPEPVIEAPVAPEPEIQEAPAIEREAPPGFEWYQETREDGRLEEGLRRVREEPTEVPAEEVVPEEEPVVEEEPVAEEAPVETEITEEDLADLDMRKRGKTLAGQLRAIDPYHPLIPDLVSADVDESILEAARETIDEEAAARAARRPIAPEEESAASEADQETEAQVDALMGAINRPQATDQEILDESKDTIARGLEQAFNLKASIAPEERVSLAQVMAAVADMMYVYIKQGVKSMGAAISRARKDLGAKAKRLSQEQMVQAYNMAAERVAKERPTKQGKQTNYEEQYKKTGLNQQKPKKETGVDRFKSSPVETTKRLVNKIRTEAFSFDFAINQKILRAMRAAGVTPETLSKAFYELQVSQAVRADSMADLFLEKGSIAFDPELVKFVITESEASMKAVRDSLDVLAKQYGVAEEDFRKYASAAFVAQRSKGVNKANAQLQRSVLELTAKGEKQKARKLLNKRYKLVHMSNSEIQNGLKFFKDFPELQNVFETWNDVREKTLNFAQQQGLYTKETVAELLDVMDYVPFYRIEQIEAQAGPKQYTRGLLDTLQDRAFKGSHKDVNDIFDNMERWTRYMIKKSMNNAVAQQKIKWYKAYLPEDIRPIPRSGRSETGNTVSIWEDGTLQRYEFQGVDGETMVKGFTGLEPVVLNGAGALLNFLRKSANFQRLTIVTNPIFSILQVPMDMFSAMFTSGVRYPLMLPLQVMKEIPATILNMSKARAQLRETGTVGRNDFYKEYYAFDVAAQQEVKKAKTLDKILNMVVSPLHALSVASDNVVRQAVYNQIMLETKDKARAVNAAEEVINFRRTGSSGLLTIFRQLTPFVTANMQALHVSLGTLLGSGINNDTRAEAFKRVMATGAQIAAVSLLYTAMKSGDDEYEKLDPAERDRFFILNDTFKIPMRNDIFTVLFKVIPEHTYNYLIAQSEDGAKLRLALKNNFARALAVPSPIPTLLTPAIEAGFNIDTVNNRPLLGAGQEGIEAELQFSTKYTTEFAKMLGENSGLSPIVIDNFIRDWTGTVGVIAATAMSEYIAENRGVVLPEKTTKEALLQYPFFGQMLVKDVGGRNLADYYELRQEVNKVVNSYNRLNGYDFDKAEQYLYTDKNLDKFNVRKELNYIQDEISDLRKYERYVRENKRGEFADPAEKATELRKIDRYIQDMLGYTEELEGRQVRSVQVLRSQAGM